MLGDDRGERAIDDEVVALEHIADTGRHHHAAQLAILNRLAGSHRLTCHCPHP